MNSISSKLLGIRSSYLTIRSFARLPGPMIEKVIKEPPYLEYLNPRIPYYPILNIQVRGYDYGVLEKCASYLHRMSINMGIQVSKFWCQPNTSSKYEILKKDSNAIDDTHVLNLYERNIQVKNLSAKMAPIYIELVQSSLAPGVMLSLHPHDHELHEIPRYIPDMALAALKTELNVLAESESLAAE